MCFSQVLIPGIIGPGIGAKVLANEEQILNDDGTYSFVPNENIFLAAFVVAIVIWFALALVLKLKKKEESHAV